jgi:hypothetical protein
MLPVDLAGDEGLDLRIVGEREDAGSVTLAWNDKDVPVGTPSLPTPSSAHATLGREVGGDRDDGCEGNGDEDSSHHESPVTVAPDSKVANGAVRRHHFGCTDAGSGLALGNGAHDPWAPHSQSERSKCFVMH